MAAVQCAVDSINQFTVIVCGASYTMSLARISCDGRLIAQNGVITKTIELYSQSEAGILSNCRHEQSAHVQRGKHCRA